MYCIIVECILPSFTLNGVMGVMQTADATNLVIVKSNARVHFIQLFVERCLFRYFIILIAWEHLKI